MGRVFYLPCLSVCEVFPPEIARDDKRFFEISRVLSIRLGMCWWIRLWRLLFPFAPESSIVFRDGIKDHCFYVYRYEPYLGCCLEVENKTVLSKSKVRERRKDDRRYLVTCYGHVLISDLEISPTSWSHPLESSFQIDI
jgi:hypothetical protein